ncbi:MAG TPA: LPS export ABC transporter permease LptF [Geobacteraceae bacterium]|nr:LPS export ABC transporter permease LptF [Geobacteraceae bacterium]
MYDPAMLPTLYRYLTRELLSPFLLGLFIFTGLLLVGRMLKLVDMVVSKGVPVSELLLLILYLLPNFAVITIPMALLLGVLLAFSRLSADSEIIAIKASGISLYRLLPPVILISVIAYALTAFTALYALPKGNVAFKNLLYKVIQGRLNLNLKEQTFNNSIPGLLIYIDKNDEKTRILSGIMIQDERNPKEISTIFATSGSLDMDEKTRKIHLHLSDGSIHQSIAKGAYRRLEFKEYELSVDLSQTIKAYEKNELDMSLNELRDNLKTGGFSKKLTLDMGLEIHRRFTLPFACFIFAIVAMPLGVHNRRSGKAAGFSLSIVTLLLFYVVQSIGRTFAEKDLLPLLLAAWLPNILFLSLGIYLFNKAAKEESIGLMTRIKDIAGSIFRKRTGK